MATFMDPFVDPCDDFYMYACGGWINQTTLPSPDSYDSIGQSLWTQSTNVVSDILKAKQPKLDEFYKSCLDATTRNELGVAPLHEDLNAIVRASSKEAILRMAASLVKKGVPGILQFAVAGNPETDATRNTLFLAPSLPALERKYYAQWTNPEFASSYGAYVTSLILLAGYDRTTAQASQDAVLQWERDVNVIENTASNTVDSSLFKAAQAFPLSVGTFLEALGFDIDHNDPLKSVVLLSESKLPALEALLQRMSTSDLKALVVFKLLHFHALNLSESFAAAHATLDNAMFNVTQPHPLAEECRVTVPAKLSSLVDKYYLDQAWSTERGDQAKAMTKALEAAFNHGLDSVDWLDNATLTNARAKMAKLVHSLGGPMTTEVYPSIVFDAKTYVANIYRAAAFDAQKSLASVYEPVDRLDWGTRSPQDVNAGFRDSTNTILVHAAIMQSPYFGPNLDPAQNFGAMGMFIGHEIVHGFDSGGRKYDGDGNKRNWWSNASSAKFDEKAACLADQYGTLDVVSETTGKSLAKLNGTWTLRETIADNGGLKAAFRAYQAYIKTVAAPAYSKAIGEKMFYTAFGQAWCEKNSDAQLNYVLKDVHLPGKYRVWGAIRNNDQFARVFNCQDDLLIIILRVQL
ncbi:Aste57867_23316 [Aphanomyces stellatus]|uniref:Aste57867_23316 protein n=1 Tax=Aphanomyces stellatus TaxID=120398 RepID=A0A485LP26_9STRA|nr:hypothetical protein As57867_023245 [Aphanomyces stellatus]VFT99961.1 Aste57867_23316 [Aphanomyces stellatus]